MTRRATICLLTLGAFLIGSGSAAAMPAAHAAACEKRVTFGVVDARTAGCLTQTSTSPNTWESTDLVNVNGIPLQALPGTRLVLKGPSSASAGGSVGVKTKITLSGVTVFDGGFNYNFPAGAPGDLKTLASWSPPAGTKIKGFSLGGSVSVQMGKDKTGDQAGYARFELIVKLPDIFKNSPGQSAGSLTGTVAIRTDAAGVHADTLKIEVANAYVGQLLLKNVCLSFVSATSPTTPCSPPAFGATKLLECTNATGVDRWDGSALIQIPTAAKPDIGLFAGTVSGDFAYAGAQATNLGNSVPLVQGVYLDRIGLGICLKPGPLKLKGAAGIRFGPAFNGTQAANMSASLEYIDSRPWVIKATGSLALFNKNVASGYFTYRSDNAIDFGFNVGWNFYGVLDLSGNVAGWYQARPTTKFDVYGSAKICVVKIVCAGGEAAVSSTGVAGCASITVAGYPEPYWLGVRWKKVSISAGAGYRWGSGGVNVMGTSCGVGSYRASKGAVAAASGSTTIQLAHTIGVALNIHGLDGAPDVEIAGPDGRKIVIRGAGQIERNKYFAVVNPADNTTSVTIAQPAAGAWTITPLPGSSPISGVAEAPVNPPPGAGGEVTGKGTALQFHYVVEDVPGDTVTFYERGTTYEQQLGTTAGGTSCLKDAPVAGSRPADSYLVHPNMTCGDIPFSPAAGPAGVRDIIAVVDNHGEPVTEFLVTKYDTTGLPLPSEPRDLKIVRDGTTVTITWAASTETTDYNLDINLSDGSKVVDVPGKSDRRVVLHGIAANLDVTAKVAGIRSDGVVGPALSDTSKGA